MLGEDGLTLTSLGCPACVQDVLNVWIVERHHGVDSEEARMVTSDSKRGIRSHFWSENSRDLLYLQDVGGDENWHIHCVHISDDPDHHTTVRDLTPFEGVRASEVRSQV